MYNCLLRTSLDSTLHLKFLFEPAKGIITILFMVARGEPERPQEETAQVEGHEVVSEKRSFVDHRPFESCLQSCEGRQVFLRRLLDLSTTVK